MPAPVKIFVVAHTHWDREWYHAAERFRQRLVPLVDELLDDPPARGTSFLLDGQAVVLDDYLAVRPDRAAALAALLREGRLEAGPWYVLADELIPSGEALVRNLLAGRDTLQRLGAEPPPVLYCPDSFGHPAILPELAAGFGCQLVVLWRGYGGARWPAGDTVRWNGPSGGQVLLYHLPPAGYEFGSTLPVSAAESERRWQAMAAVLLPRSATGVLLLLNGADHHARQAGQAEAVRALGESASPHHVVASSLSAAAAALVQSASDMALPVIEGELRDSYGYTWTLGGTLGSRPAQKRRNALAERTLVRDVEPWLALSSAGAAPGVRALLHAAWRDVLLGHPHDTLCGTSVDSVARALDHRLDVALEQSDALRTTALQSLVLHDAEAARHAQRDWRPALVLRNPSPRPRAGVAEVVLETTVADIAVGPGSATRQGVAGETGEAPLDMGMQVLSRTRAVSLTESPRAYPDADVVERVRGLVWASTMGGYTTHVAPVHAWVPAAPAVAARVNDGVLDNGPLRAWVSDAGDVHLHEMATDRTVRGLLGVELRRDVGDLYTPALRERLDSLRFAGWEVTARGPLRAELRLRWVDDESGSEMSLRLALDAGLAVLRMEAEGVNAHCDVRLRLVVRGDLAVHGGRGGYGARGSGDGDAGPAAHSAFGGAPHDPGQNVETSKTVADAAFHPVTRTPLRISAADAEMEHVVSTAPLHRYVSRYSANAGVTLFSDGLAEYESLDPGAVAVTLVRAVGALSRHDLPERPGHAGWPADTPDAQSAGPWAARFAVALHGADSPAQRDAIERLADDVLLPIAGETLRSNLRDAGIHGGLELHGDGLAFSAAMPARREGWIVLRCVNRREEPSRGRWRLAAQVHEARIARLDETPISPLVVDSEGIHFDAEAMEIVTVLARI